VIGETSAGKSSLLTMISGVVFPSGDGVVTKNPTRLRMEKKNTLSITI